jgi:hypothetical protein
MTGWATKHIAQLQAGKAVAFRPKGNSMTGRIASGQLCTVTPLAADANIKVGDVVLCSVRGRQYLHLVYSIDGDRVQIGNNKGHINGWTPRRHVYGTLIAVAP